MHDNSLAKKIVILGATGSIGQSTLKIVREYPERFKVIGLTANCSHQQLLRDSLEFRPEFLHLMDSEIVNSVKSDFHHVGFQLNGGMQALINYLAQCDADLVVAGMVGNIGLLPVMTCLKSGLRVALANKETLVSAGHLTQEIILQNPKASIIPVDSEHSAIFQCLQAEHRSFKKLILTASGGRFRQSSLDEIENTSVRQALEHPNWSMGNKITIDSSTLMNKGLEVIEAHWLFNCSMDQIEVVVHPQSIIHSMVEFEDLSVLAQLGWPDMTIPIHYALTYPNRMSLNHLSSLDLIKVGQLNFEEPDLKRFPCLKLAYEAGRLGHSYPAALNAANEVAVDAFLNEKIKLLGIPEAIEWCLENHKMTPNPNLEAVLEIDRTTRLLCQNFVDQNSRMAL